jgi:single-strand DNA-binding protein
MATDNTVTLIGNLTDDPELRFTSNGAAVANFRLAVTPRVRQGDTWTDGETSFFRINCWRQLAENVTETPRQGRPRRRDRSAAPAVLGDRRGRAAQHRRGRGR